MVRDRGGSLIVSPWTMSIDDRYGTMVFTMAGEAVAFAIFEVPLDARAGDGADDHFSCRRQANCSALEFSAGKRSQRAEEENPVQLLPGWYEVTVWTRIDGRFRRQSVGFDVTACDFNPNVIVDY